MEDISCCYANDNITVEGEKANDVERKGTIEEFLQKSKKLYDMYPWRV